MNRTSLIYITFACLHGVGVFVVPQLISVDGSASFLRRNWGYHFLTYFPIPVVGLAYVLFIASLTPAIQSLFVSTLSRISVAVKGKRKSLVYLAISTLALAVLWGLRQKYPFLGDGYVRSSELDRGIVHGSAGLFIRLLLQTSTTFDLSGIETYRIVSTLLGVPLSFSRYVWPMRSERTPFREWLPRCSLAFPAFCNSTPDTLKHTPSSPF